MPEFDARSVLREAIAHHQAGRAEMAEPLYRQILQRVPGQPDALHMLGLLAHQAGHHDAALTLIGEAARLAPDHAPCHSNLGNVMLALGRVDEAIGCFQRALALNPEFAEAHNNLGNALREAGRPAEAATCYARALSLRPEFAEAHNNLGFSLAEQGRPDEAIACLRRALALRPEFAEAHNNLGMALEAKGQPEQAMACLEQALALRPDYPDALNNLGNTLKTLGRLEEAVGSYRRCLAVRPGHAGTGNNLGLALAALGRMDDAIASYDRAIAARPDFAEAHFNKGITLLLRGDYAAGWPLYEWRWKAIARRALLPEFSQPLWLGDAPLAGRSILLHHEQGLGDTLQMLRYVPLLARRGARVILLMPPSLAPLAAEVPGADEVVIEGDRLPAFDLHCPMMSLPLAFGTTLAGIPAGLPYLSAPAAARSAWQARIRDSTRPRIGLAWCGSISQVYDQRPVPLRDLLPLLDADAGFFSLQKEYRDADGALMRADGRIADFAGRLHDLGETAGLIAGMDLVITIDTAVAHLAGAMGRPVWLLLSRSPDWRWGAGRGDSPWYPGMRLFRQTGFGNWQPVVQALAAALTQWQAGGSGSLSP